MIEIEDFHSKENVNDENIQQFMNMLLEGKLGSMLSNDPSGRENNEL